MDTTLIRKLELIKDREFASMQKFNRQLVNLFGKELSTIQKDLRTLERAVYSENFTLDYPLALEYFNSIKVFDLLDFYVYSYCEVIQY